MSYRKIYRSSVQDPETFWDQAAQQLSWEKPYERVFKNGTWFADGRLNICYNSVDRHVENGRADQPAVIYDSPVTGVKQTITFRQLLDKVSRFAGALQNRGVGEGDRVLIYMPMTPEVLIAMLACARLGAIHSVVFGGFASNELAVRIDDARPKLVITSSCGIEVQKIVDYKVLLDKAIEICRHKPKHCIVHQRPQLSCPLTKGRDVTWEDALTEAKPTQCVPVAGNHPLYILYTSGTTGKPKGVVRDTAGYAVALKWSMEHVYGLKPGEVYWAASDVGWVVGHSYITYGPLLHGCTTLVHEGKPVRTPDAGNFWRIVEEYQVAALFTAPTAIRAIKLADAEGDFVKQYDISTLRTLFLAGERCDPDTYHWARSLLGCPVVDHWWQTETGWPVAANPVGIELLPVKPGSPSKPVPGYQIEILDENGEPCPPERDGAVVIKRPLPPGCFLTLWEDEERCHETYYSKFPGFYFTGDGGYIDEDGYIFIMGRIDDVIIVSGHNLSTGSMEEVVAAHPDVVECAVFGVRDDLRTQVPLCLLVLGGGVSREHSEIVREVILQVREKVGPVANLKNVIVVERLPKTRSGKILRATLRKLADGEAYKTPSTIEDPTVLDEITNTLESLGFGKKIQT